MSIANLRREYSQAPLDEKDVDPDPLVQFTRWFEEAIAAELPDANAMALATATPDGHPSVRIVLLKGVDERGLVFFTDYRSRKAIELDENPRVALAFYWHAIERQVRVEGAAEKVSAPESDAYFLSRPVGSRLGAWASPQSTVIPSRQWLDAEYARVAARFAGGEVPRPEHWGGYRILPDMFEFWQGRPNRLHDRLRYRLGPAGWILERLAP
jgi:pyridoxamine 5'-phosphate oxidase